jgi:hypothetical protein
MLAVPLSIALLANQPTHTLFIQIATYYGLPVVMFGFVLAIFVQLALDLGGFIARLRRGDTE